jgi:hypothetical protein
MWNRFGFLRHGCRFEKSVDKGAVDNNDNTEYTKVQKEIAELTEDQNSENDEVKIN